MASREAVSLRSLSRSSKTAAERAAIAAAILDNGLAICGLSTTHLAVLFGTTTSAINKHRAHRGGGRPKPNLADLFLCAAPAERLEVACAVGVEVVWDTMIVPALGQDGESDLASAAAPVEAAEDPVEKLRDH